MRFAVILLLALPLAAQTPDAKPASVGSITVPLEPVALSLPEQFDLLLVLENVQESIAIQQTNIVHGKGNSEDVMRVDTATKKYNEMVVALKKKAGATDTPTKVWYWDFLNHKWVAQTVGG